MKVLVKNISEIATPLGFEKKCGKSMKDIKVYKNAYILTEDGVIVEVAEGKFDESGFTGDIIDAENKAVIPGFCDSHTHFIFGGYRDEEYDMRLKGASYMEIQEAGGGIKSTVAATREESFDTLYEKGLDRLDSMLSMGVTTVEGKSGYGLDIENELKQLDVMEKLDSVHALDIVKTYMPAHDVPFEYKDNKEGYIDLMINKGIPSAKGKATFFDIFTEKGIFEIEESRRLLQAAKDAGFKLKLHADEIVDIGGGYLAGEMGAVSADHLLMANDKSINKMIEAGTIQTLLPVTAFSLNADYARARVMIDNGGAVALGSDFNPGSCHSNSISLMIALATIYMKMTIEETLTALTLNGAAAMGREKKLDLLKKENLLI